MSAVLETAFTLEAKKEEEKSWLIVSLQTVMDLGCLARQSQSNKLRPYLGARVPACLYACEHCRLSTTSTQQGQLPDPSVANNDHEVCVYSGVVSLCRHFTEMT